MVQKYANAQNGNEFYNLLTHKTNIANDMSCFQLVCVTSMVKDVIKLLFKHSDGFWENDLDGNGNTVIHHLCEMGRTAVLSIFLKRDEEKNYVTAQRLNFSMQNCLHTACEKNHGAIVRLLVEKVPSLTSMCDERGKLPFHITCEQGHLETAQILFEANKLLMSKTEGCDDNR